MSSEGVLIDPHYAAVMIGAQAHWRRGRYSQIVAEVGPLELDFAVDRLFAYTVAVAALDPAAALSIFNVEGVRDYIDDYEVARVEHPDYVDPDDAEFDEFWMVVDAIQYALLRADPGAEAWRPFASSLDEWYAQLAWLSEDPDVDMHAGHGLATWLTIREGHEALDTRLRASTRGEDARRIAASVDFWVDELEAAITGEPRLTTLSVDELEAGLEHARATLQADTSWTPYARMRYWAGRHCAAIAKG